MTSLQLSVLSQCAERRHDPIFEGAADLYLWQAGRRRQVNWLAGRKYIRLKGCRWVATREGIKALKYFGYL